ncbi:MAG TPA: lipoprotein insertase outer membrane protein LolB [Xanthomonadaceae bacterium]|jgi:outer membrane lipoprotein LolB
MSWRRLAALAAALALAACVQQPVRRAPDAGLLKAQADREAALAAHPDWSLSGRIAISDGRDGGSGHIDWIQHGSDFDIRLSAPVTRQSWRMVRENGHVRLEGLDGGTHEGDDAQELLQSTLGWIVPVDALAAWARGVRARPDDGLQFGADGLPSLLSENGWTVEYRAWDASGANPLPQKVFASQGEDRVRLSVDHWTAPQP